MRFATTLLLAICFGWASATEDGELALCQILIYTPNYSRFKLHEKANCLAHVKSYEKVTCLRNDENQVNKFYLKEVKIKITCNTNEQSTLLTKLSFKRKTIHATSIIWFLCALTFYLNFAHTSLNFRQIFFNILNATFCVLEFNLF